MSEFFTGEIANAKVGRNLVEVEILECGEGFFRVKSVSSRRASVNHCNQRQVCAGSAASHFHVKDEMRPFVAGGKADGHVVMRR